MEKKFKSMHAEFMKYEDSYDEQEEEENDEE